MWGIIIPKYFERLKEMYNIYWYYGLAFIGLGIAVYTMEKKKNIGDLLSFILMSITASFLGEYFILGVFNGYNYKTGVFPDYFADQILGHVLSNVGLWCTTSAFVGAFQLKHRWILLISVLYMAIEELFLRLNLYEHHWWRTYLTGIAAFIFFSVVKKWFFLLDQKRHGLIRRASFFLLAFIVIHTPICTLMELGKLFYRVGLDKTNPYRDTTLFIYMFQLGAAATYTIFICILKKWYWKLVPIGIFLLADSILMHRGVLVFQGGFNLFYLFMIRTVFLVCYVLLEKYTFRPDQEKIISPEKLA